ncbi:MAG: PAS domain S-box protein [Chlorobiales bacterium]|nr:PAS domain S-box protein [Chlorobiales bacterium]
MKKENKRSREFIEMRNIAEQRLIDRLPKMAKGIPKQSEMHQIIRKLAIHKIELEMQWEALFQSHQELEEGLKHNIELYDFAQLGFLTLKRDGTIEHINPTCKKLLAQDNAFLDEKLFDTFVADRDRQAFNYFLERLFISREGEFCEVALNNADKEILVRIAGSASDDAQLCRLIVQDITGELFIKKKPADKESVYRFIAENTGDVIWLYDFKKGKYIYVTPSVYLLVGYTPEEIQQQSLFEILTPDSQRVAEHEVIRRLDLLRSGDESARFSVCEFDQVRKDNSVVSTEVMTTFILDENGDLSGIIGVGRDVSERKRMEREKEKLQELLLKAKKMEAIARIASGIGHDFNNKLQSILAHTDLLLDARAPESQGLVSMQEIRNAVMYCAGLTNKLLAFAKKRVIAPKELDINAELSQVIQHAQYKTGSNISISFKPVADTWRVKMDPSQVEEIMEHLITNALEAIVDTGTVTVSTSNETITGNSHLQLSEKEIPRDYVVLEVRDTGYGMEKEVVDYIFEPFFTSKKEHAGLGLSTVYGIVEQNKGFITADSTPGVGTILRIYLPRFEGSSIASHEVMDVEGIPRGSETILLVDDEESNRITIRKSLESFGYKVIEATDAKDALSKAAEYSGIIHMLLADVILPGMNGKELAEHMIKFTPRMKTLFMSGYSADVLANEEEKERDESIHFLKKPFSRITLSRMVRKVLDI